MKAVAAFLLLCAPALADLQACQNATGVVAVKECLPLASHGNPEAQFHLGFLYFDGLGVPQDFKEAVRWYRLAADQGHAQAQFELAGMYAGDRGVPQDYGEAARWYRLAADQGNTFAQFNLGSMYMDGQGVPQDYIQAHMWFNLAGASGFAMAVEARDTVAKKMTLQQIAEAQRLAREWKPKASR